MPVLATSAARRPAAKPPAIPGAPSRLELTDWRYRDGLEPSANAPEFDDSKWEVIKDPAAPRGSGGLSYGWYRATVTVPERLGNTPVAGRELRLTVLAEKYAEVWVDGQFRFQFDPAQPPTASKNRPWGYEIAGFTKANVIPLGKRAPGTAIKLAVLVINGPISKPIGKYALRQARLELVPLPPAGK
jgi:hypothetical protein